MKRSWRSWLVAIALFAALFAAHVLFKMHAYAKLAPPEHARTFAEFEKTLQSDQALFLMNHDGRQVLVCRGPVAPVLAFPSGPAAYIFDEHGALVDWTPDVGDTPRLDYAQLGGTMVGRVEARRALVPF